ncbi:hypothetical protein B0H11DRAFT_1715437 [Mycena galericulata]|nr:hypothetical protein B0H11DRAFT_1715437 [Mycena galericulata]
MDQDALNYIINHLFLPPKLPQEDDSDSSQQDALLEHISTCARLFCEGLRKDYVHHIDRNAFACWETLRKTLGNFGDLHNNTRNISHARLEKVMNRMGVHEILCLHIVSQNAGLILRRRECDISLEFFQASPPASLVTETKGKLIIRYPSRPRLSIPLDGPCIKALSTLIASLDCTDMPDAIPKTFKAGGAQDETRDVRDIRYISEVLGGIARTLTPVATADQLVSSTVYATKRINDHVLWRSALLPWRRSPKWLIARVVLQTTLEEWGVTGKHGYKAFVAFVLAETLRLAIAAGVSSDMLFIMSAKLATRMSKLQSVLNVKLTTQQRSPFPVDFITQRMSAVMSLLENRWKDVQDHEAEISTWTPPTLAQITAAKAFTLPRSATYFQAVKMRATTLGAEHTLFSPGTFEQHLLSSACPDIWLALLDLERRMCTDWKDSSSAEHLKELRDLLEKYQDLAASFKNPEIFSRIFLAVLDLWVLLDKCATAQFPLLLDYSPGLCIDSFEPLLLPELSQMRRLHEIEIYVTGRHAGARYPSLSVFSWDADPNSLPSRYFNQDPQLQELRSDIQRRGSVLKDQKTQELDRKTREYHVLVNEKERTEHEHESYWDSRRCRYIENKENCIRCSKENEIKNLSITSFEWPLPENDIPSRLVVFELSVPLPFSIWREVTYRLARKHANIDPNEARSRAEPSLNSFLRSYSPLSGRFVSHNAMQRITIASTAKSFDKTHYRKHKFPCNVSDVVQKHPLQHQLWDEIHGEWLPFEFPTIDIRLSCTPQLPSGPYEALAWSVVATTHTSNDVIARQSQCPSELSHHDWDAFGHLRAAGVRLQWRNIMLQVITSAINLADPSVYLLIRQAAWQAEAASDDEESGLYRQAHFDLSKKDFGAPVVDALRKRLDSVSENWKEGWTAATLGVIACRLLSITPSLLVQANILEFLSRLRRVLFKWMEQVLDLLNQLSVAKSSAAPDLVNRVLQLAASCRSTYAVRSDILSDIFRQDRQDKAAVSIFVRCAIVLHTNAPGRLHNLCSALRYLLERDAIVSTEALSGLVDAISRNGDDLDAAIKGVWEGFLRDAEPWRLVGERWVTCLTSSSSDRQVLSVHFNLLDGSLLVDGKSQGTLPPEIIRHPFFVALFPNRSTFDIVPSTMKGMDYQSRNNVDGYEVHFKLKGDDLLVRVRNGGLVSEFIPAKYLEGDIPTDLLVGKVHIFHEQSQSMVILAAPSGWDPRAEEMWRLDLSSESSVFGSLSNATVAVATKTATETVLDPASHIVQLLSKIFRPLEARETNLTVYTINRLGQLKLYVSLPRYDLEFFVNGDVLESKELPGFYVSPAQSIGTLVGLANKLVLKSRNGEMAKVFVPEGKVSILYCAGDFHPQVTISPPARTTHVKAFSYDVDDILGRLVGDGSLISWYRLAYLHIATTSFLSDPLTRHTGMRQAQEMLDSAQAFAFMALDDEQNGILQEILDLTPIRKYYPEHLKAMETIEWNNFPSLSQCGRFVPLVESIVDYARNQALFYSREYRSIITAKYKGETSLWERADFRVSRLVSNGSLPYLLVSTFQIDVCDVPAPPARCLESLESTSGEDTVANMAALVRRWPKSVNTTDDLWRHFQRWATFSSEPVEDDKLDHPAIWLLKPPSQVWFRLFHLCRAVLVQERDQYGLMVALGILAYRGDIDHGLITMLLALATNPPSDHIHEAARMIPLDKFDLKRGHELSSREVWSLVDASCRRFYETDRQSLGITRRQSGETQYAWDVRSEQAFTVQKETQRAELTQSIFNHWPGRGAALTLPDFASILSYSSVNKYPLVKITELRHKVEDLFMHKLRNRHLFESTSQLQHALNGIRGVPSMGPIPSIPLPLPIPVAEPAKYFPITLKWLFRNREDPLIHRDLSTAFLPNANVTERKGTVKKTWHSASLRRLVADLEASSIDGPKAEYITALSQCVEAFEGRDDESPGIPYSGVGFASATLEDAIQITLGPQTLFEQWLHQTGQWPSTGPESIVRQLSRESRRMLPAPWKVLLSRYAEELAVKQQGRRIAVLAKPGFEGQRAQELGARGSIGWDPSVHPDWLLIQLDADIIIRPLQASIAQHMMSPQNNANALLQLNMGEGKTSVIVPIISTSLADGIQLVRVIVLKPLSAQMFQLLKQRVCGLANRRLFYLPFSRDTELDSGKIDRIFGMLKECAEVGGILLCQPEHLLSFQLMGLDNFCQSENSKETRLLTEAQEWLDNTARDILDESDEILSVRYQLIYTLGISRPLEGQPWHWNIIQEVFSLLEKVVKTVGDGVEFSRVTEPRRFPMTRILTPEGRRSLLEGIVEEIIEDGLQQWISFRNYSSTEKDTVRRFLMQSTVNAEDDQSLRRLAGDSDRFGHFLLLRGLFSYGILALCLQDKRWRVDYGLDPKRSMLAVPYRAKDRPAPRAEFGHPDMIIVLTCLSYYYGGLTDDQLNTAFKFLQNSDNPAAQYEHWVKGIEGLPASLANLRGLNLDDFVQKTDHIFPLLRYNKAVIDFYLSECVFPKEAREFSHKLTTNAWDLARTRPRLTTGFSGTNDNRYLLPLSIEQLDQDSQRHTNAQVLEYILKPENRAVLCTDSDNAIGLLKRVVQQKPCVMVLLDVGAQVLELQNDEVAREWLKLDTRPAIEAVVYFESSTDEIRVISRDGRIQPLVSSLYKTQLQKTLVYLDEAHTRGTDFKFPAESRAVVTLGPKLTKDKLVQGCMRMRRLGKDHSVLFFASTEICGKITAATKAEVHEIDSSHVLLWTIKETCEQIRDNGSLWANQGLNFDTRRTALEEHLATPAYARVVDALQERESHTLEELYGIKSRSEDESEATGLSDLQIKIRNKCQELGINPSEHELLEEQERELSHEKENERELERVPAAKALEHFDAADKALRIFIRTGMIEQTDSFISLEDCLAHTSWISILPPGKIFRENQILATKDFRDTIVLSSNYSAGAMNQHLRPVQWILSTSKSDVLIVVSPFQANKWLPDIRRSQFAALHLYSPRISRSTLLSFESLNFFTVPTHRRSWAPNRQLIHELNLFAGQLFCKDKASMKEVCAILGLHLQSVNDVEGLQGKVDPTGFVRDEIAREALGIGACSFASTPLPFFRELFGARRKGQGFTLTHMGQILRGNDPRDEELEEAEKRRLVNI